MSLDRAGNLLIVVRRALRQPFSLVTMLAGVALGMSLGNPLGIVPIGLAAVAVGLYTVAKLNDEEFIRAAIRAEEVRMRAIRSLKMTFRVEELDADSRVRMKNLIRLQNEIAEDVANSPIDEVSAGLAATVDETDRLVERGLEMAGKRRELLRYLTKTDPTDIRTRIDNMAGKASSETDETRRAEMANALAAKRQELADYEAIEAAGKRILDQLDSIECAFSSLRARLVRIKSTDISDWTAASEELQTELMHLNTSVDTLEQSISEALAIGGAQRQ